MERTPVGLQGAELNNVNKYDGSGSTTSHGWGQFGTCQWDWDLSTGLGSVSGTGTREAQSQLFLTTHPLSFPREIPHESEVKEEIHGPICSHTLVPPDWDFSTSILCRFSPNPPFLAHTPVFTHPPFLPTPPFLAPIPVHSPVRLTVGYEPGPKPPHA